MPPEETTELKAPNPPAEETKDDITGLKNKNYELIGEQKRLKQSLAEREALLQKVTDVLGTVDPESLAALKAAQEREKEIQEKMEAEVSRAQAEADRKYQEQVSTLAKQLNEKQQVISAKAKEEALNKIFQEAGGLEFEPFKALFDTKFTVDYVEEGISPYGTPIYKVDTIKDKSGKVIYLDGNIAKPEEILGKMRRGNTEIFIAVLCSYNQSTGAGLPLGITNKQGVVTYKRSQQAILLQQPGMAERMLKGEVVFED